MDKWIFDEIKVTQGIVALQKEGRLPTVTIKPASAVLKRHQKKRYASAVQFSAPVLFKDCGRYNPPGGSIAVWYAVDSSVTAAAEAYGRLLHLGGSVSYPESVLYQHYMCSVDVTRPVEVIDVVRLCQLLHIPPDSVENESYSFTQWLMWYLHANFGSKFDGISYSGRHYRYKRCYAFWERTDKATAFADTPDGMVPYASYRETDADIFPDGWPGTFMTGEEIFEELLNFKIMSEPM